MGRSIENSTFTMTHNLIKSRKYFKAGNWGFTLIELLVVISIIGILAGMISANINSARAKARDVRRRADLKQVQIALELYYQTVDGYPYTGGPPNWWGNCTSYGSHPTSGANGWVPNLAPTYMTMLPLDPKPVGTYGCYLYVSNGTDYKLLVHTTMETTGCPPMPSNDSMWDPARSPSQCSISIYTPGAAAW